MSKFPDSPKDENCRFANGKGYVQHKKDYVDKAAVEIKTLISNLTKEDPAIIMENKDTILKKLAMDKKYYINK